MSGADTPAAENGRHTSRTPPFAFTRRLVVFICIWASAVTAAAFFFPDTVVKIIDLLKAVAGIFGGCILAYAGRTALTDNAAALAKLFRGGP